MINPGQLNQQVTFSRQTRTADGMGGWTVAFSDFMTCWAEVKIPASKGGIIGGKDVEIRSHLVTIRDGGTAVKQDDRIVWNGQTLVVRAVRPDIARHLIQLDCTEYVK